VGQRRAKTHWKKTALAMERQRGRMTKLEERTRKTNPITLTKGEGCPKFKGWGEVDERAVTNASAGGKCRSNLRGLHSRNGHQAIEHSGATSSKEETVTGDHKKGACERKHKRGG